MEIWRDIEGYEGIYQVSNLGNVKSLERLSMQNHLLKEKILKPRKITDGYLSVSLCKNNKVKQFSIHRLVATAFISNSSNKPYINHIDCDPSNNNVDNLEWVTQKENLQYASKLKRMNNDKKIPIIAINLTTKEETYFNSQTEAAEQLNLSVGNINNILKGKYKKTGNYTFKYINNQQENTLF
jgi:hypothetical protein